MVCILSTFCPAPLTGFLLNSGQFNVAVHAEVISNIHLGPGCGGWPGAAAGARAVSWWPPISPRAPPRPTCHVSPRASPTTASHWHWQYTGLGVSCATARDQLSPHTPDPDQDAADQASAPRRPSLPGPGTCRAGAAHLVAIVDIVAQIGPIRLNHWHKCHVRHDGFHKQIIFHETIDIYFTPGNIFWLF